jgi:hypothetical protein
MKLRAMFELDRLGRPMKMGTRAPWHYTIFLYILDAPERTRRVTYKLHETYSNPLRIARSKTPRFEEEMTSYGDYSIVATADEGPSVEMSLSEALRAHYKENPPANAKWNAPIAAAIGEIAAN